MVEGEASDLTRASTQTERELTVRDKSPFPTRPIARIRVRVAKCYNLKNAQQKSHHIEINACIHDLVSHNPKLISGSGVSNVPHGASCANC